MADISSVFSQLDSILESTNLEKITADSSGSFESVPDGYYLCKVDKANLGVTKDNRPKASLQLAIIDDGIDINFETGDVVKIPHVKNRKIFITYVLDEETKVKNFISHMLKFEDENGESLLSKECFTSSELIEDSLDILTGSTIFVNVSTSKNKNGEDSTWNNLISWKRAAQLELIN